VKLSQDLISFSDRIGHGFAVPDLLIQAVTHASISSSTRPDNQRLEFLGDRVLGLVMAEAMLAEDPEASEGVLAPRFNAVVRKEACAEVARQGALGAVLTLGRSEPLSGGAAGWCGMAEAVGWRVSGSYCVARRITAASPSGIPSQRGEPVRAANRSTGLAAVIRLNSVVPAA